MRPRSRAVASQRVLLRRVPSLERCSDRELDELRNLVDVVFVDPGSTLVIEGRAGREAFLIIEGRATAAVQGEHVGTLGPGQYIGEVAMLDRGPRTATVVAETPMCLLVVGPEAFGTFARVPAIAAGVAKALAGHLRLADSRSAGASSP